MNRILRGAAFATGLFAVTWVGVGYLGGNPLALLVTVLIGATFLAGGIELARFQRDTAGLDRQLAVLQAPVADLNAWLGSLPAALRPAVRLRIDGERVALPGPPMTPYLVGLLVLLGMLGTFLGLVVTLNGAVSALESTTDLQTIRSALSAPVRGLGVAFGTSVAGVAASAMLGLIASLCRRERQRASHRLDDRIATVLRDFSRAHQREQRIRLMQRQVDALPGVVDKLDALMTHLARHHQQLQEQLLEGQARFHDGAGQAYATLATSVERALAEGARLAGDRLRPMVEATLGGIARETAAHQAQVATAVGTQLDGLAARFDDSVARVTDRWMAAQASHERSSAQWVHHLEETLSRYDTGFAQRSAALADAVARSHASLNAALADSANRVAQDAAAGQARSGDLVERQLAALAARIDASVAGAAERWSDALARHDAAGQRQGERLGAALAEFAIAFDQRADALLAAISERATAQHASLAALEEARRDAHSRELSTMAAALAQAWQQAGTETLSRQEQMARTFGETARELASAAKAQAAGTIDEVSRLMQAAADAPRAAAEAIGELRAALGASMARDNEMLAERGRIMDTLGELLSTINHAANEQRQAIDALVAASAGQLGLAGQRLEAVVDAQAARMDALAGEIGGGAAEVASLGEAFGLSVRLFGESNDKLMTTLARIEGALERSLARSDDQLAYYVAQAREIIDLSLSSQKDIVEDLQKLATRPPTLAMEA